MSTSARRLRADAEVTKFVLAPTRDSGSGAPKLIPVAFPEPSGASRAIAEPSLDLEARELHLPSVSTERVREVEDEACQRGYARGLDQARDDADREREQARGRLRTALEDIGELQGQVLRRAERDLVRLALAIAERVIKREVTLDPDLLLVIARVALDRLGERPSAVVRLNPGDHAALADAGLPAGLDIVPDPGVPPGGCQITSTSGDIDAGIDAQLRELSRELLGIEEPDHARDPIARAS